MENRSGLWADLGRNVFAGIRLALFLPVRAADIRGSWSQFIALIVADLLLTFAGDLLYAGFEGRFTLQGVVGGVYHVPLVLLAAAAFALAVRRPEAALRLTVALLALMIPFHAFEALAHWSLEPLSGIREAADHLPTLWLVLAASAALARMQPERSARNVGIAFLSAALFLGAFQVMVWRDRILWTGSDEESESAAYANPHRVAANEDMLYLQPRILERELAAIQGGRKGTIDLYFVGLAGYANQDVFMKELDAVDKLFRERFDTAGRSIRLINNPKAVGEAPIASVTALRAALDRIGEVMDRDEDVLFLFMTSHGSEERFSLEYWPLNFHPLDPETLRKMLDDAGIKRRVVVVSACYSGIFIEPLSTDESVIITASARDRNSFGCSDLAEFTYFGKAYFDEALRETRSFIEAFEKAKSSIEAREKREGKNPSRPQMRVGEQAREPLKVLERRLAGVR